VLRFDYLLIIDIFRGPLDMTEMLSTIFITGVLAFFPGLLIGYVWAKKNQKPLIQKAYDKAKEEFDMERVELSDDLNTHLSKIRQSIIQSVEAYEEAAKAVEDKCLKNIKGHVALNAPKEEQRQLDFFKGDSSSSPENSHSATAEPESLLKEDDLKRNYTENALEDETQEQLFDPADYTLDESKERVEKESTNESKPLTNIHDWDKSDKKEEKSDNKRADAFQQ